MRLRREIFLMAFADAEKVDACLFGKLREADNLADPLPFRLPFSCMWVRQMIAECIDAELEAVVRIDAVLFHVLRPFALRFPNPFQYNGSHDGVEIIHSAEKREEKSPILLN